MEKNGINIIMIDINCWVGKEVLKNYKLIEIKLFNHVCKSHKQIENRGLYLKWIIIEMN